MAERVQRIGPLGVYCLLDFVVPDW